MHSPRSFGRRTFLRSLGGAALSLPFLASLQPKEARAQTGAPRRRFIALQSYSGQVATEWYPTALPAGYQARTQVFADDDGKQDGTTYVHQRLPEDGRYGRARLTDFAPGPLSNVLGTALHPYLDKVNLIRGIDYLSGTSHNMAGYLGNLNSYSASNLPQIPTIDQVLAHSTTFYGGPPRLRSLHVGTGSPGTCSYTDYGVIDGPVEQVSMFLDPAQAFDRAFSGFMAPELPRDHPNRSLLNGIFGDYRKLATHPRLSAADRQTLDRHLSFLADLERGLQARTQVACTVPPAPRSIENGYPWGEISSVADFEDTIRLFLDVVTAAIQCDVTRVVTIDIQKALTNASGSLRPSYHNSADIAGDWHQFAHDLSSDQNARRNFVAISQWIASSVFAPLLARLDVEEEGGRTFLDNTLVVWGNELGYEHYSTDIQTVMAGSAGGALKTGYYLDYIDWQQSYANKISWGTLIPGLPQNRWWVTMLQAMGLGPADYERGGRRGYGFPDVIDTPWAWPGWADMDRLDQPLPGIMA